MVQIIEAKYLLTPDRILKDMQIAFQERIVEIGKDLRKKYPDATFHRYEEHALLPGFCNPHLHLEFSANEAMLSYGDFLIWLQSVIRHRERLIPKCDRSCLENALKTIVRSGTTTIGAISSYGEDLASCVQTPLNVAYFTEIIGSNPATADVMYADFIERYYQARKYESERFKSCVAIHSPYSVHRILAQKALDIARKHETLVSVHFMESRAEREWIDSDSGEFRKFFEEFLGQKRAANRALEFLELFEGLHTLYVHAIWAKEEELQKMKNGAIIHCPVSNRLLGNGVLDLDRLKRMDLPYTIATDGLSSNYSLNIYEELRAALFLHPHPNAVTFAKELITRATTSAKDILGFESGKIEPGFFADLQIVKVPEDLIVEEEIYLHLILHTHRPQTLYLKGVEYA